MKRRILFVDDDLNLLQGLQRMLRGMRHEWDMEFVGGGPEALERLGQADFDVIVSDVRMPRMDGIQLLKLIREQYPKVVRILLSGQADNEKILNSVGPAHQFLAKPCDPENLKAAIARCCAIYDCLSNEKLRSLVSQFQHIPTLPALYRRLLEELESPEVSVSKIGAIIEKDVGMTARVLHLVNSAFFGLPRRVTSAAQAVTYLGTQTLKDLVLVMKIFEEYKGDRMTGITSEGLWNHSLETGMLAKKIMQMEGKPDSEANEAFTVGMLHDVGIIVLSTSVPDHYRHILQTSRRAQTPLQHIECEEFGASHAEIGGYLLGIWGLPTSIVEAVTFHHRPSKAACPGFQILTAVHVASAITTGLVHPDLQNSEMIDENYLDSLGLTNRIPAWKELCRETAVMG